MFEKDKMRAKFFLRFTAFFFVSCKIEVMVFRMLLLAIAWRLGLPKRGPLFRQLWTALDTLARFMAFLLNMGPVASCLKFRSPAGRVN